MPGDSDQLLRRIEGEYLEMPGLTLTRQQAQRLWSLDVDTCAGILQRLVERKFLVCGADGRYRRLTEGAAARGPLASVRAQLPAAHPHRRAG